VPTGMVGPTVHKKTKLWPTNKKEKDMKEKKIRYDQIKCPDTFIFSSNQPRARRRVNTRSPCGSNAAGHNWSTSCRLDAAREPGLSLPAQYSSCLIPRHSTAGRPSRQEGLCGLFDEPQRSAISTVDAKLFRQVGKQRRLSARYLK